jgi:transposase
MFSLNDSGSFPEYYKQYLGSVPDVSAFQDIINETRIKEKDSTIIADKGVGSNDNYDLIEERGMNYIIPLRRGNLETKGIIPSNISDYKDALYTGEKLENRLYAKSRLSDDELASSVLIDI